MKSLKQFILHHFLVKNSKFLSRSSEIDRNTFLVGKNSVGDRSKIRSTRLGFQTYIGHDCDIENTVIGNYTCISHNVAVVQGKHPIREMVSMHPAFFSKDYRFSYVKIDKFDSYHYIDKEKKIACIIGNDVWIGFGAIIMAGIKIGDGAVIGAGAVVTKDVEPYSVVAGCPAQVIKYRFEKDVIKRLLEFKWWEKDENWISKNISFFDDKYKNLIDKD